MTLKKRLKTYTTKLTLLLSSLTLCLVACAPIAKGEQIDKDLKDKFRGINGVVIDTSSFGRHQFVTITSETGRVIDSPSLLARGGGTSRLHQHQLSGSQNHPRHMAQLQRW